MSSVLRRLMMKKSKKESDARQRLKKELFAYTRGLNLGFPSRPTSLDYDPTLSLIAVGTKTGSLRIYGAPGVELYAQHYNDSSIIQVCFLPGQARLISLCSDDSVNLWEADLNTDLTSLKCVRTLTSAESKMEDLFRCCIFRDGGSFLVMSKGGFILDLDALKFSSGKEDNETQVVPLSSILSGIPSDLTANIVRVVSFLLQPSTVDKFLIGYSSGLIVIWDHSSKKSIRYFNANQSTESLSFSPDGAEFVSSHSDGSYIVWSTESSRPKDQPACPYGPFPCSSIQTIKWRPAKNGDVYLFFSGGMPRASHSDKNTVTVMNHSSDHVVFELSSRVVDFIVVVTYDDDQGDSSAEEEVLSLLILAEEEFVAIDLLSPDWPTFELPYMQNIQSSPILCSTYNCDACPFIVDALVENSSFKIRSNPRISPREWPITGGKNLNKRTDNHKLLALGHEDGSIEFFCSIRTGMKRICRIGTSRYFLRQGGSKQDVADEEEKKSLCFDGEDDLCNGKKSFNDLDEWPPFRKVGTFDPRGDDPQLSIRHLVLSRQGQLLIAAGNSGHVMVFEFLGIERGSKEQRDVAVMRLNIVEENSGYSWVGHEPLILNSARTRMASSAGYQLMAVLQVMPPVEPTCISFDEDTSLLSVGTVYGYAVFDLQYKKVVMTKRTLIPQGSSKFLFKTRSISLRKSFGESFKRLRRRKSGNSGGARPKEPSNANAQSNSGEGVLASSGEDGQRCSSSVVSRSSETSPSTSKPQPTGSSSSHTLPIFPTSSSSTSGHPQRQRSNSDTRSNPELTEGCSEEDEEDVEDSGSRSRNSRRSTPSRSVTVPNAQKLVRPRRGSGAFKKIAGGSHGEEPKITEVSTLSFARTFLTAGQPPILTLWVGTSVGAVYVHQLDVPPAEKRAEEGISCCLAKEINFKRRHPVVFVSVLSRSMRPISRSCEGLESSDLEVEGHSVIIVTQGQFKLFSLPSLKMTAKYNLIGVPEAPRICKADIISFISKSDGNYVEHNLVCLDSHDLLTVFNFPQLKIQLRINNLKVASSMSQYSIISPYGEALLFNSPSELCHLSLSTHSSIQNWCTLDLKPGTSRPPIQLSDRGPDGVVCSSTGEDLSQELPLPHVIVSEHQDDGGDDGDAEERTAEMGSANALPTSQSRTFQGPAQQSFVSLDGESEFSGSVSLSGNIPSSAPFVTRSVSSSRTVMSRSTVSRSVNGEIITETSTDLERISTRTPPGSRGGIESDV